MRSMGRVIFWSLLAGWNLRGCASAIVDGQAALAVALIGAAALSAFLAAASRPTPVQVRAKLDAEVFRRAMRDRDGA